MMTTEVKDYLQLLIDPPRTIEISSKEISPKI